MDFWPKMISKTRQYARFLASAEVLFFCLPWLMVLVILGTITQKQLGLYDASEKYFNSVILWLGPVPTPGGLSTIGVIFIALTVKFIFFSKWQLKESGIILTHLGILLLLSGGIVTAAFSKKGFMIIPEGRNIDAVSDYYRRVVSITPENGEPVLLNFDKLKPNQEIDFSNVTIKILELCQNCSAQAPGGKYDNLKGLAKNMELVPVRSEKEKETNFSGMVFALIKAPNKMDLGTYIIMEDIPKIPVFTSNSGQIEINLGRAQNILPFSITLNDFRKINYPGTTKAREFESDLIIKDGDVSWPVTISMNKPLRYKGYTFYQSSFEQQPDIELTVLSVVQNLGRAFPYISTLIIFIGLLLHLVIRLQRNSTNGEIS